MNLWKSFVFGFSSTRVGAAVMKVSSVHIDPFLFKLSGGRFTSIGPPVIPQVLITTTGRKSGRQREAQLVYTDIDGVVHIVASNFGGNRHPAWSYNLDANPEATMQLKSEPIAVSAERLTDADKAQIWDRLVDNIPNYAVYRERTDRNIKVYRLVPTADA
jgi:deazaflavin-dependent oxidoreductase (nitroreductase family)